MDRFLRGAVRTLWTIALLLVVVPPRASVAQYMPPVLDPKTYRAPSGRFVLTIDPSDIYGCGAAKCQLKENGKPRWSATLPFTLCAAAVTDRGATVGYAYTKSPAGWPNFPGDDDLGKFVVAIVDVDGKMRLQESAKVEGSPYLHGRPSSNVDRAVSRQSERANKQSLTRGTDSAFTRSVNRRQKAAPPARSHLQLTGLINERVGNQLILAGGRQPAELTDLCLADSGRAFSSITASRDASCLNQMPESFLRFQSGSGKRSAAGITA